MKAVVVINTTEFAKDKERAAELTKWLSKYGNVSVHDMALRKPLHEHFFALRDEAADLYIFLNGAGFELRTEADNWSPVQLGSRIFVVACENPKRTNPSKIGDVREYLNVFSYDLRGKAPFADTISDWLEDALKEAELI